MIGYIAVALAIMSCGYIGSESGEKVVIQDGMILIFDSADDAKDLDTRKCYNAVASPKIVNKISGIIMKGESPKLRVKRIENFFDVADWKYNYSGHYKFKGRPVAEFCERKALIVIRSAELRR